MRLKRHTPVQLKSEYPPGMKPVWCMGRGTPHAWNLMKYVRYFVFLYFDPIYSLNNILTLYRQRFWIDHCDKFLPKISLTLYIIPACLTLVLKKLFFVFFFVFFLLCGCLQVLQNFRSIENIYWQISVTSNANFSNVQGFNLANFLSKKLQNTICCNTSSFTVLWFLQHSDLLFFLYYWTWIFILCTKRWAI